MWSRAAAGYTWEYIETRTRAQAEKRFRKMFGGKDPEVAEYAIERPDVLTVNTANPKIGEPSWTYIDLKGEWWFDAKDFPESYKRILEERNTYEGAGLA